MEHHNNEGKYTEEGLTFVRLQNLVKERSQESMAQTIDAPVTYFTTGLAEEAGEVCGAVKKIFRANMGLIKPEAFIKAQRHLQDLRDAHNRAKIAMGAEPLPTWVTQEEVVEFYLKGLHENLEIEIGQVVQYLCNICTHYGLNFDEVVKKSFNHTSKQFNSTILIP